jgi:hypothetical protein
MPKTKKEVVADLIERARSFRSCSPSDDPEEITGVTSGYRYLVVQFKRLAGPMLPEEHARRLDAINVEIDNVYSVYDAMAELDALIPDIEVALELPDYPGASAGTTMWIVESDLIARLAEKEPNAADVWTLVRSCKEINSSYAHGNVLATVLLMRTVLNHVPPVFGHDNFAQVVATVGKSLKESFEHLENGLRKIADFHAHRKITATESYPSTAQVEPFKPQFELLLQQVETRLRVR